VSGIDGIEGLGKLLGAPAPATGPAQQPLTAVQTAALAKLHEAATQFEGVFLQMVMSSMRDTVPKESIFGKDSASEETWQGMLDDEYSQAMAKSGGLGLAEQLERQMRPQVLGNAAAEAHTQVDGRITP
jgi:Rod binding domain-containing protein